uniref:ADP,ATP carrier protein n=1 Tax=Corethron hystrix TaxID=216773 RepID=A0A7S1BRZ9_9STRA|mmetsp:Transcript_37165/g.86669  ORF Transcript_37165/g.86669 Transcript_37165/m.86669 type:complete len:560 (+) Transcript_37165:314-1993(+)
MFPPRTTASASMAAAATVVKITSRGGSRVITPAFAPSSASSLLLSLLYMVLPDDVNQLRMLSVCLMALSMALHYLGYEFARSATVALFTASPVPPSPGGSTPSLPGFGKSSAAIGAAMAAVCPTAAILLAWYGRVLDFYGPRGALRVTGTSCAAALALGGAAVHAMAGTTKFLTLRPRATRAFLFALFVFRESYVQLLGTQHWSFMGSVLKPEEGRKFFAPIAGASSVAAAVGGTFTRGLVGGVGLGGLLVCAAVTGGGSVLAADAAYRLAEHGGFDPREEKAKSKGCKEHTQKGAWGSATSLLFKRVPVLGALYRETLACQSLSSVLNVMFFRRLTESVPNDGERAGWTGKVSIFIHNMMLLLSLMMNLIMCVCAALLNVSYCCSITKKYCTSKFYASINVVSCVLQFGILPAVMKYVDPAMMWRAMPTVMMTFATAMCVSKDPSLHLVGASFLVMKSLEYSIRGVVNEMVYVPLDFESRYLGKEVIGVFAYRLGKSGTSLLLSGLATTVGGGDLGLRDLGIVTAAATASWTVTAYRLANLVSSVRPEEGAEEKDRRK